tara:strand:+ start:585 stop:824 length:240 start_codon:yes stop_codon:yes gene_type:complete
MHIKKEIVEKTVYKTGIYFELIEIRQIVEALYVQDKDSTLAHTMNNIHRDFNDIINKADEGVIEDDILNNADCKSGVCD